MKKNYLLWVAFAVTTFCHSQTIFINEIHYDNTGGDTGEGVEIAGPAGTDLAGYKIEFYNGVGFDVYNTKTLSGIIPNQQNNRGALWFDVVLQNGSPDGLALVDNLGAVIQFLSYEGVITATGGPATGLTSVDIGVTEPGAVGESLQLIGSGFDYTDFSWVGPITASPGLLNSNQTLAIEKNEIPGFSLYPNPVLNGKFRITSNKRSLKQVEIYSTVGKRVFVKNVNSSEIIDVSNLNTGVYILKIQEDGIIVTRKLIID